MGVAKISFDMKKLIWSTFVGGAGNDWNRAGFALDANDEIVLAGETTTGNFASGGGYNRPGRDSDLAVAKPSADGSTLRFAARWGGAKQETVASVRVASDGSIHLLGHTWSADLPTVRARQTRLRGGIDALYARLSADGMTLLQPSYLGGSGNEFAEHAVDLGRDGSQVITGFTSSSDFAVTAGAYDTDYNGSGDAFIGKLAADGQRFEFLTFFGGSGGDVVLSPVRDARGDIYFVGQTSSRDMPVTADALQEHYGGGRHDGYFGILSADGTTLLYGTYIGGSGDDFVRAVTLGRDGSVYLVGVTDSADFPTTKSAFQTAYRGNRDGFVMKLKGKTP